jgi:hypothetical protein
MTQGLLVSRRRKNLLCSLSIKKPFEPHVTNYKNFRNLYFKILKLSKQLFFQTQLKKHQSDSKKTWEILRKILNSKKRSDSSIISIVADGRSLHDPTEIADKFNKFFTNVASSIVEELRPCNNEIDLDFFNSMEDANWDSLNFNADPLTHSEIVDAIGQLNDKLSLDKNGLSSNFIKKNVAVYFNTTVIYFFKFVPDWSHPLCNKNFENYSFT